jgi:1,2-diacylglycerol 3-beta-galactosyltransferase
METTQSLSYPNKKFLINVVTISTTGGHYATYNALHSIIEKQQLPWQLSVIDVDLLTQRLVKQKKVIDLYRLLFGIPGTQIANQAQQKNWKYLQKLINPLNKLLIKLNYDTAVRMAEEEWRDRQPDLVISLLPHYNKIIWESFNFLQIHILCNFRLLAEFANGDGYCVSQK